MLEFFQWFKQIQSEPTRDKLLLAGKLCKKDVQNNNGRNLSVIIQDNKRKKKKKK